VHPHDDAAGARRPSNKPAEAAKIIGAHPAGREIRRPRTISEVGSGHSRRRTISEVGAEHTSTTALIIPGEFLAAASAFAKARMDQKSAS
jgi:hypothetical protein